MLVAGGNVTMIDAVFVCPVGAGFEDVYGGLYGSGAYGVPDIACGNVLVSELEFQCTACSGTAYSMQNGSSTGIRNDRSAFSCFPCESREVQTPRPCAVTNTHARSHPLSA